MDEIPLKRVKKSCELVFVWVTLAGGASPFFAGAYFREPTKVPRQKTPTTSNWMAWGQQCNKCRY